MKTSALALFALAALGSLGWVSMSRAGGADSGTGQTPAPAEIRRGVEMGGSREERAKKFYQNVIRKVEPSGVGDPNRLPQYVELFKREFVEDPRTFAFKVDGSADSSGAITLTGWVEFDEHRRAMNEYLGHLGLTVAKDELQVLPDPALGESGFAIVGDGEPCFVYDKPAAPRETFTQALPGDAMFVLKDFGDGTLLCHAGDGYVGYVNGSTVRRASAKEFDAHLKSRQRSADREARIETAIAAAHQYMGTKYVWGGRSQAGIDCSGLVHAAFRAAGVSMPRDADQQSLVGTLVGARWHRSSLERGDVLFFLGRRGTISHTGIYLGDGKFIEAVSPVVKISDLNAVPDDRDKSRGDTLCFAKRVFE